MLRGTKILFSWKLDLGTGGDSRGTAAVHSRECTAKASQKRRKARRDGGADETESEGKENEITYSPQNLPLDWVSKLPPTSCISLMSWISTTAVSFVETTRTMDWSLPAAFCWIVLCSWHEVFGHAKQCPLSKCTIDWGSCLFVGQANTAEGFGAMASLTPTKRMRNPVEIIWKRKEHHLKRQRLLERSAMHRFLLDRSAFAFFPNQMF